MPAVQAIYRRLTPRVCLTLFAVLIGANAVSTWRFLTHDCPIDLSGDEAQYWDWSRHLDYAYYSKGPLVAWIIRASCHFLGDSMPAVRLPAILLAIGTSVCTYRLTWRLFGSHRLALGAVLIGGVVPMFVAGGTLMTIDPPMYFCWAAATCLVAEAAFANEDGGWRMEDGLRSPSSILHPPSSFSRQIAWPAAGAFAGLGVLAKYGMLLWPLCLVLFLVLDRDRRRLLRTIWPWTTVLVTFAFLAPAILWNAYHDWVSLHHVASQTGVEEHGGSWTGWLTYAVTQAGIINPFAAVILVMAVVHAVRSNDPRPRFLLVIGGAMWMVCLLDTFRAKVQMNWPAPGYFTLLILTSHFIAAQWRQSRGWLTAAILFGLIVSPFLHDTSRLYPIFAWADRHHPKKLKGDQPPTWAAGDLEKKLRGIADPFAKTVDEHLAELPPGAKVLCEDYMDASQLAFYLKGRPDTYYAGSYWTNLDVRRRWTQFDIWPDRRLDRPELLGQNFIYVGWPYPPLTESFESVRPLPDVVVTVHGIAVRSWKLWECRGFKGMARPAGAGPR